MYQIRSKKGNRIEHKNPRCGCNGEYKNNENIIDFCNMHNKNYSIIGAFAFGIIGGYALKSAMKNI